MSWHTMERGATLDSTCYSGHLQLDKRAHLFKDEKKNSLKSIQRRDKRERERELGNVAVAVRASLSGVPLCTTQRTRIDASLSKNLLSQ